MRMYASGAKLPIPSNVDEIYKAFIRIIRRLRRSRLPISSGHRLDLSTAEFVIKERPHGHGEISGILIAVKAMAFRFRKMRGVRAVGEIDKIELASVVVHYASIRKIGNKG